MDVDKDKVTAVYVVKSDTRQGLDHYVLLLDNGSYFCTCLLAQNQGLVCRHFFVLMKDDHNFRYHIRFITPRWLKDAWKGKDDVEDGGIRSQTFLWSRRQQREGRINIMPSDDLVEHPRAPVLPHARLPKSTPDDHAKKKRNAQLSVMIKELKGDSELQQQVMECYKQLLGKRNRDGSEGNYSDDFVLNPTDVRELGAPESSRKRSWYEKRKGSFKAKPKLP